MRYLLLALCIGLPLSACQDTTSSPSKLKTLDDQASNDQICTLALSTKDGVPKWYDRSALNSVNEAKRRGLTPEDCAKLLGRHTVQVEQTLPKEGNIEERLTKLKNLYDKGLITQEEYENKQRELLEGL